MIKIYKNHNDIILGGGDMQADNCKSRSSHNANNGNCKPTKNNDTCKLKGSKMEEELILTKANLQEKKADDCNKNKN